MSGEWGSSSAYPSPGFSASSSSSSSCGGDGVGGRCSTRKIISSKCRTEDVDGRLIRKCEKTEKILRECVGRPVEVLESTTEHTEEDVTDLPARGMDDISGADFFGFPGLRSDVETMQRSLEHRLRHFLGAAEELTGDFLGRRRSPPPPAQRPPAPKDGSSAAVDFPGQLTDV